MADFWKEKTAVITGAGSGIGRALALAMARRGTHVVVTDINEAFARSVAAECGPQAESRFLDVRDAPAVQGVIDDAVGKYGHIDYLFNNAGVGVAGEADEIPLASWDRVVDVNLRGVIHGVLAGYPHMLRQGHGHIINTASLAGLGAAPLMTPYATTKHAVVGLSTSLRLEAQARGVRVSVICPAAVDTPLLDATRLEGLPQQVWMPNLRRFLQRLAGPPYPAEKLAQEALAAIERNQGVIVIPTRARILWRIARVFPAFAERVTRGPVEVERAERRSQQAMSTDVNNV
jgi:NAD(P)-dependent dehydrogenase (short-subunit alcohol dehydrogenase family)